MAETSTRDEELRDLLTDAIEVQLAALKAGIGFWSEWIEQTSEFVQSATSSLSEINSGERKTEDVLLELLDAGRARARSMTEIPRHTAQRFLDELDAAEGKAASGGGGGKAAAGSSRGKSAAGSAGKSGAGSAGKSAAARPKRAGRAKE